LSVTVSNQAEVGSELNVKAPPAPSVGQPGARVSAAAIVAPRRSAVAAICGLAFMIVLEAAWVGILFFVALRLIFR
jgi:hypothetical protein